MPTTRCAVSILPAISFSGFGASSHWLQPLCYITKGMFPQGRGWIFQNLPEVIVILYEVGRISAFVFCSLEQEKFRVKQIQLCIWIVYCQYSISPFVSCSFPTLFCTYFSYLSSFPPTFFKFFLLFCTQLPSTFNDSYDLFVYDYKGYTNYGWLKLARTWHTVSLHFTSLTGAWKLLGPWDLGES